MVGDVAEARVVQEGHELGPVTGPQLHFGHQTAVVTQITHRTASHLTISAADRLMSGSGSDSTFIREFNPTNRPPQQ